MKILLVGNGRLYAPAESGVSASHLPVTAAWMAVPPAHAPDVVVLDLDRPDRGILDGIRALMARQPRPVVLLIDQDDQSFMREAIEAGVVSYHVTRGGMPDLLPTLRAAIALFRRQQRLETELDRAETALHERAMIMQAKALLMRRQRLAEPDAYRWLRRQAMASSRRIADVAAELLSAEKD